MQFQLVKCFAQETIPGLSKDDLFFKFRRRLRYPEARSQASIFRMGLESYRSKVTFIGHSEAHRAKESLVIATIGILNHPMIQIPNIYLPDIHQHESPARDMVLMAANRNLGADEGMCWSDKEVEAFLHFGKIGAQSIKEAVFKAEVSSGTALIFTHWPMMLACAACLAGGEVVAVKAVLETKVREGDSIIVDGDEITHRPLIPESSGI